MIRNKRLIINDRTTLSVSVWKGEFRVRVLPASTCHPRHALPQRSCRILGLPRLTDPLRHARNYSDRSAYRERSSDQGAST